jgi:hypothetical protein
MGFGEDRIITSISWEMGADRKEQDKKMAKLIAKAMTIKSKISQSMMNEPVTLGGGGLHGEQDGSER